MADDMSTENDLRTELSLTQVIKMQQAAEIERLQAAKRGALAAADRQGIENVLLRAENTQVRLEVERLRLEVERLRRALKRARDDINDYGLDNFEETTHETLAVIDAALGQSADERKADRLQAGDRQAKREGKHILETVERYAPASYDHLTDDMTIPFALLLAEKDAEIRRQRTELSLTKSTYVDLRAEIERLLAALKPFAQTGWMTHDTSHTGRTVIAHMHPESDHEIILSSDDFHNAAKALKSTDEQSAHSDFPPYRFTATELAAYIENVRAVLAAVDDAKIIDLVVAAMDGRTFLTNDEVRARIEDRLAQRRDDAELARMSDIPTPTHLLRGGPGFDYPCTHPDMTECGHAECQRLRRCKDQGARFRSRGANLKE